jgi:antirestriction protein ArdC
MFATATAAVVAAIEAGAGKWKMPWTGIGLAYAHNPTKRNRPAYRGGNALVLWAVAELNGYTTGEWATYRQWESAGAQVRKGEKGTTAVYYSRRDVDYGPEGAAHRPRVFANSFTLFNAAQVDGYVPTVPLLDSQEQVERVEAFFAAVGAHVEHRTEGRAYYKRSQDLIVLPPFAHFHDGSSYYATSAHEHAHWTGHETRLARTYGERFGDDAYAVEELTAELSAAFTCAALGLSPIPRPDHAAYLDHWLRVLKADSRALYAIASKAQAATDFLLAAGGVAPLVDDVGNGQMADLPAEVVHATA